MKYILCIFILFASAFASNAAETLPRGDFSELRQTGIATVANIIDPQTIQLDDGSVVRLAGIDYPDLNPQGDPGDYALTAIKVLDDMLKGKSVVLYQTSNRDQGRVNRMGQNIAQIERQSDKAWIEGTLITLGLARARTNRSNPEMAQQMYDLEERARHDKTGIWEKADFKILTPEETKGKEGSFQIVEGQIRSAALKQNRIYLNFGDVWKSDFTVSIAPEDKRLFSRVNLDPLQWNGKNIRVRGWIESLNGPYMQIDHPQAIEVMENTVTPGSEPKASVNGGPAQ